MLKLSLTSDPYWLDLFPGVRLQVRPRTTALLMQVGDGLFTAEDAAPDVDALTYAKAVAQAAVLDWEGVADVDGKPLPVSTEAVCALMDCPEAFRVWQAGYMEGLKALAEEGNG